MPKVSKTFTQSLNRCPHELQAKAVTILRELAADPIAAARQHSVTTDSRAIAPNVYKVRLNDNFRLVLQRLTPNLEWFPIFAGKHEDVDRFIVRYQPVVDAEDRITILPGFEETRTTVRSPIIARSRDSEPSLFDPWANEDLIRVGVPVETISLLRKVRSGEEFDQLRSSIPQAAFERLEDWLTAPSEKERTAILGLVIGTHRVADEETVSKAIESPENYEEIVVFEDPAELSELIEKAPLEDWMLYLHPEQKKIVEQDFDGPARIRGISGSGKTVILAHRARRLARILCKQENDRILVATHSKVLAGLLGGRLLPKLCGPELYHIEVDTVHGWAAQFLEGVRVDFDKASHCLDMAIQDVKKEYPAAGILNRPNQFFQEEISQVIRGRMLANLETYQALQRRGRGSPLTSDQRGMVWWVFEKYINLRNQQKVLDADDLLDGALRKLVASKESMEGHNYRAVLVDEAQDLTELGLRLLSAIAGKASGNLFLVGDGLQKIYRGGFSLRRVGIDIHGRAKVLKKNFRNTRSIMAAAYALVSEAEFEDFDEEGKAKVYPPELSVRQGEQPVICKCRNVQDEVDWVSDNIEALLSQSHCNPGDIAVLYRGEYYRNKLDNSLRPPHVFHRDSEFLQEDAVKVSTIQSSKGMEFKVVFIVGLTEEFFQWAGIDVHTASEEERNSHLELTLRLLYVAMTRARDLLFLSYPARDNTGGLLYPTWFLAKVRDHCQYLDRTAVSIG
ncbi:MAG: UvrD-helicase domain-containing protein [Acidobacteria bacterium]|nr:UvrD-helicase domain-containing protein [Acidobacteriota bacterium]